MRISDWSSDVCSSDLILVSLVIAHKKFREMGLRAHSIGTVHDAMIMEVPANEMSTVLPMVKEIMDNPPLDEWFGIHMSVPRVDDCKVGQHWGDAIELNEHKTLHWEHSYLMAARKHHPPDKGLDSISEDSSVRQ